MSVWKTPHWLFKIGVKEGEKLTIAKGEPLSLEETRWVIRSNPSIIPPINSEKSLVYDNVFKKKTGFDEFIFEEKNGLLQVYLLYYRWYYWSSISREFEKVDEAYSAFDDITWDIDEDAASIESKVKYSKNRRAVDLRRKLRKYFNLKRISISPVYAIIVVDDLSLGFYKIIDYINEITDTYVYGLDIHKYITKKDREVYLARIYEW